MQTFVQKAFEEKATRLYNLSNGYRQNRELVKELKQQVKDDRRAVKSLKKEIKKDSPIPVKNVTRGTYIGMKESGVLKRDDKFVLLLLQNDWHVVTWAAKTAENIYVVQTFPIAAKNTAGLFSAMLKKFPPKSREWLLVKDLTIPTNCENILLTAETAEAAKGLYTHVTDSVKLPKAKALPNETKKYRKGR